jgi:hypothetical protein
MGGGEEEEEEKKILFEDNSSPNSPNVICLPYHIVDESLDQSMVEF